MAYDLDPAYKQVPERIADLKAKHPDACLRPLIPERPYWIESIADKTYIVYAAACYRSPDDPMPGVGVAWEPFPGRTPYTRDSELQNAETSAWGRAIVAALASESKAVASAEDVRNRQVDHAEQTAAKQAARGLRLQIASLAQTHGWDLAVLGQEFTQKYSVSTSSADPEELAEYLDDLQGRVLDQPDDPQTPGVAAAQGAAPGPDAPADAPPSPSPPEAGGAHPGKSAQDFADELTAATSKADVIPVLRALEIAGHGATEVADGNGEAVELRTYANARMKTLR